VTATEPLPVSRFLTEPAFAPVDDELDVHDLDVTGSLPPALDGVYLRNGSNPRFSPTGAYHWFDGDGMVHGVYLADGRARYKNRWVDTPGLRHERAAGRALFGGILNLAFPPDDVLAECGLFKNAANTNVIEHAGAVMALWEGGFPTELTRELDTVGLMDFGGKFVGAFTAHPKWDRRTGELVVIGYTGMEKPYLRHHVIDATGALTHSTTVDIPRGVMMHDFLTTERWSLIFDLPVVVEPEAMMRGEPMWQPGLGARIGVLPRHGDGDQIRWFDVDPFYVFHFLNAWEDGERIVAIGCRLPSIDLDFEAADTPMDARRDGLGLHRWTIDLAAGTVREEQLDDVFADFPRLHDDLVGYRNRYGHVSAKLGDDERALFDAVVQYDLASGTTTTMSFGPGTSTGEAVFAADPDGRDERDGWVLTYVTDLANATTDLVVLDGHDVTEEVARVHLPRRVPAGFHGNWLPTTPGAPFTG
jgi:carotenoid cleavage dioxygenase